MNDDQPKAEPFAEAQDLFAQAAEQVDPFGIACREAERLRARRSRGLVLFAVFLFFLGLLSWLLFDDLVFFFGPDEPRDLGRAEQLALGPLAHNSYIRVTGIARDMCIRAEVLTDRMRYLFLLGSKMGARILVQAPDPGDSGCVGAVERRFEGRVVDLARSDRYDAVLEYYRQSFPTAPQSGPVYLLEHGVRPRQAWYFPLALGLMLCLAAINVWTLRRIRRRSEASAVQGGSR